jgi:hypothetical protein
VHIRFEVRYLQQDKSMNNVGRDADLPVLWWKIAN